MVISIRGFTVYSTNHLIYHLQCFIFLFFSRVIDWSGIISRSATEQLLLTKPIGSYLIRINEKIFGYALSYRGSDHCRHLLIEVISSDKHDQHSMTTHTYRFLGGAKHELFTQLSQLIDKYSVRNKHRSH
jgi:hypothetical protein